MCVSYTAPNAHTDRHTHLYIITMTGPKPPPEWFLQFTNREYCEEPPKRDRMLHGHHGWPEDNDSGEGGGICIRVPGRELRYPPQGATFSCDRFKKKLTCEVPPSRPRIECATLRPGQPETYCRPGENDSGGKPWRVWYPKNAKRDAFPDLTIPIQKQKPYASHITHLHGLPCLWVPPRQTPPIR